MEEASQHTVVHSYGSMVVHSTSSYNKTSLQLQHMQLHALQNTLHPEPLMTQICFKGPKLYKAPVMNFRD